MPQVETDRAGERAAPVEQLTHEGAVVYHVTSAASGTRTESCSVNTGWNTAQEFSEPGTTTAGYRSRSPRSTASFVDETASGCETAHCFPKNFVTTAGQ